MLSLKNEGNTRNNENEFQIHSRKSSLNENLFKSESTNIRSSFDLHNVKSKYTRPSFLSLNSKFIGKENIRTDIYGNKICKGSKKHKVTFVDQISREKIAEIVIIHTEFPVNNKNLNTEEECQCSACIIY